MATPVAWAGRMQATATPKAFDKVTGIAVTGTHAGDFASGDDDTEARQHGDTLLATLAERAGVALDVVQVGPSDAAETGPALSEDRYYEALEHGAGLADAAVDSGTDLIVLSGHGPGTQTAAVAVASHMTRTSTVDLSPRLHRPGGLIDDNSWMARVAALRDTFARVDAPKRDALTMVTEFGGAVIATAAAVIMGAALRRTPVLIDGPVGFAAALVARDFSLGAPKWCYAPDRMPHPVVDKAAKQIGMAEPLGFGLDVGEGCAALHATPLLQDTLRLVERLPFPDDVEELDESDADDEPEDELGAASQQSVGEDPSTMV